MPIHVNPYAYIYIYIFIFSSNFSHVISPAPSGLFHTCLGFRRYLNLRRLRNWLHISLQSAAWTIFVEDFPRTHPKYGGWHVWTFTLLIGCSFPSRFFCLLLNFKYIKVDLMQRHIQGSWMIGVTFTSATGPWSSATQQQNMIALVKGLATEA